MRKGPDKKAKVQHATPKAPNFTRPVWGSLDMSCEQCSYNDQDIDTFPCAKCHTRH